MRSLGPATTLNDRPKISLPCGFSGGQVGKTREIREAIEGMAIMHIDLVGDLGVTHESSMLARSRATATVSVKKLTTRFVICFLRYRPLRAFLVHSDDCG
jgi:hypothetical protein